MFYEQSQDFKRKDLVTNNLKIRGMVESTLGGKG